MCAFLSKTLESYLRSEHIQSETEISAVFQFSQGYRKESSRRALRRSHQTPFLHLSRIAIIATASLLIDLFALSRVLYYSPIFPTVIRLVASMPSC